MLSAQDIQNLLAYKSEGDVLSLYVDAFSLQDKGQAFQAFLKESLSTSEQLKEASKELEFVSKIMAKKRPAHSHHGLAVFASQKNDLWQTCSLPMITAPVLKWQTRPFLAPLLNILDQHRRYAVLLIDENRHRIIEVFMGASEEIPLSEPVPAQTLHTRLQFIASQLMHVIRSRRVERIILGAPAALQNVLINHLHTFIQDNLIVDPRMQPGQPDSEIITRVMNGEKQSQAVRESVLVFRLLDAVKAAGMGVVGIPDTLRALHKGQIRMLLVKEGLARLGRKCSKCHALVLTGKHCLECSGPTEPVFNIISEITLAALEQHCEVFHLAHDTRLNTYGGIGAELSFTS